MSYFSRLTDDDTFLDLVGGDPRYTPLVELTRAWMRTPCELSIVERELVATYVSALNECPFCIGAHRALAVSYGLDPGLLDAVLGDGAAAAPAKLQPVLNLARKCTSQPSAIQAADVKAVLDVGYAEETAEAVIAIASLFNMLNRLLSAYGLPGGVDQSRRIVDALGPNTAFSMVDA